MTLRLKSWSCSWKLIFEGCDIQCKLFIFTEFEDMYIIVIYIVRYRWTFELCDKIYVKFKGGEEVNVIRVLWKFQLDFEILASVESFSWKPILKGYVKI